MISWVSKEGFVRLPVTVTYLYCWYIICRRIEYYNVYVLWTSIYYIFYSLWYWFFQMSFLNSIFSNKEVFTAFEFISYVFYIFNLWIVLKAPLLQLEHNDSCNFDQEECLIYYIFINQISHWSIFFCVVIVEGIVYYFFKNKNC